VPGRRLLPRTPLSAIYPQFDFGSMERIDWTHALSLAATLALAVGAICILLFAM